MSKLTERLKELALPEGIVYQPVQTNETSESIRNNGQRKGNVVEVDKAYDAIKARVTDGLSFSFTADQAADIRDYIDWLKRTGRDEEVLITHVLMEVRRETGISREREVEIEKELRDILKLTREVRDIGKLDQPNVVHDSYKTMSDTQLLAYVDKNAKELKPIPYLTKDQALMVLNSGIWKNWSAEQLAGFQSTQRYLSVGLHEQKEAASKILERTVTYDETVSAAFDEEIRKAIGMTVNIENNKTIGESNLSKLAKETSASAYNTIEMDMQEQEQEYEQSQGFTDNSLIQKKLLCLQSETPMSR